MNHILKALIAIAILSLTSCISSKNIVYWQDAKPTASGNVTNKQKADTGAVADSFRDEDLIIQPYDVLDIHIKSSKQALDNLLESNLPSIYSFGSLGPGQQTQQGATSGGPGLNSGYFTGFLVDGNGNVNLPTLGFVQMSGLTIQKAKSLLLKKAKDYIVNPYVDIKFMSFKVQVLGNVRNPGTITIANEKANLLEVISLAGDLSEFGNSKRIKIIRGDLKKNYKVYIVDMTSLANVRASEAFYLKPNDVIYVEPLPRKFALANLTAFVTLLTGINTVLILLKLFYPKI